MLYREQVKPQHVPFLFDASPEPVNVVYIQSVERGNTVVTMNIGEALVAPTVVESAQRHVHIPGSEQVAVAARHVDRRKESVLIGIVAHVHDHCQEEVVNQIVYIKIIGIMLTEETGAGSL